jgi:hypothetical protein
LAKKLELAKVGTVDDETEDHASDMAGETGKRSKLDGTVLYSIHTPF